MKKCASCTKDLPDAALHCVFCGAKQPPAPAAPQGLAKTVMGYSASEMIEQLKQQGNANARPAAPAPSQAPYAPPPAFSPTPAAAAQFAPAPQAPAPNYGNRPPPAQPAPSGGQPFSGNNAATAYAQPSPFANPAPLSGANAKTVMAPAAPNYPPQGSGPGPSMGGPGPNNPMPMNQGYGGGVNQLPPHLMNAGPAHNVSPAAAIPVGYAGQTASREGRPIEPWKDSLRLVMLVWGAVLLAGFATPLRIDPLVGHWNTIIDGDGMAKIVPLVLAAVGLLSVVFSSVPMTPAPRGLVAASLGLAGFVLPFILSLADGKPFEWQELCVLVAYLTLIPGLLVRQQYRDALLPRLLVTIGVIAYLVPHLIPTGGGDVPLVNEFKAIIDAEGTGKIMAIVVLFPMLLVVMSLLVWLPAPAPGGANLWAILLLIWPIVEHITTTALHLDGFVDAIKGAPNEAVFGLWLYIVPYLAILSFGFATLFGKQLE